MFFFAIAHPQQQPFRTKQGSSVKKLRVFCNFGWSGGNPFARNEVRVSKTDVFVCDFTFYAATLSYETRFGCQKLFFFFAILVGPGGNRFARNEVRVSQKLMFFLAILYHPRQPFRTK